MLFFLICHLLQAFALYVDKVYCFGLYIHMNLIIDTVLMLAFTILIVVIITLVLEVSNNKFLEVIK